MPDIIKQIRTPDGTTYDIKDAITGYITSADLPAISVNTTTKTLLINQTVDNADAENF